MSSTNRSRKRGEERALNQDYYVTPPWAVREFLTEWNAKCAALSMLRNPQAERLVLDPCAGGDKDNEMTYPLVLREWDIEPLSMDIRDDSRAMIVANYLTTDVEAKFDLIITNPPFNLAKEIIEKSLHDCADEGYVIMLLRLNFFGGQKRAPWLAENRPDDVYIHTKRMGFNPVKPSATDSIEYGHFIWYNNGVNPDYTRAHTIIHGS